jgi:cell wall-associated NlpC family hydrolase
LIQPEGGSSRCGRKWMRWGVVIFTLAVCWSCAAPRMPEPPPASLPAPQMPAPPIPAPRPPDTNPLASINFTIQVGAFNAPERAAAYALELQSLGLDAFYFIDTDGFSKVRFDRYPDKASARQRALSLKARGIIDHYYIVTPNLAARHRKGDPLAILREGLVRTARRYIGKPYRWGGASVRTGFDCSGLTMTVYRLNGLDLPRNSRAQFDAGIPVSRKGLKKGDLVFFYTGRKGRVSHVGIYAGAGKFIHAPRPGKTIRVSALSAAYYHRRYMGARRYF